MTASTVEGWASVRFRKSSASDTNGGQCVEVGARLGLVALRDSKSPGGGLVEIPVPAWARFLAELRN
ncbi:DUF397 domain-containing protein [Actinophytocola sediminis]